LKSKNNIRLIFFLLPLLLASVMIALPAGARISTDFDPNLDFSKLITSAFIGGVEQLVRLQLNPEQLNTQVRRAMIRELTANEVSARFQSD
jgi:hypothetical protein